MLRRKSGFFFIAFNFIGLTESLGKVVRINRETSSGEIEREDRVQTVYDR